MNETARPQIELREACVAEALRIIADVGIEDLSLREVARRLGVSHQAPYRHFPSRDHLLAEVVDRCFRSFDDFLGQAGESEDPADDLDRMGRLYLDFARTRPLEFRLMFGAKLPDPEAHPHMLERGTCAFDQLRHCLGRTLGEPDDAPAVTLEAMWVWSAIHGLASILEIEATARKGGGEFDSAAVTEHALARIKGSLRPA